MLITTFININLLYIRSDVTNQSDLLINLDGGIFNSLINEDVSLTNFSTRNNTLNNISPNCRQDTPWRLNDDVANIIPRNSSIRLNFIKSARQIEDRLQEKRRNQSDDFSDEGSNGSLYIFRKATREQYGGAKKSNQSKACAKIAEVIESAVASSSDDEDPSATITEVIEPAVASSSDEEDPSAFVAYSKELLDESRVDYNSDNGIHGEEQNNIEYTKNKKCKINEASAHTPAKFADLETNRCEERLAKIGENRNKKSASIMQFQMIQSVIGGEFFHKINK